jgi:hypothetical protein
MRKKPKIEETVIRKLASANQKPVTAVRDSLVIFQPWNRLRSSRRARRACARPARTLCPFRRKAWRQWALIFPTVFGFISGREVKRNQPLIYRHAAALALASVYLSGCLPVPWVYHTRPDVDGEVMQNHAPVGGARVRYSLNNSDENCDSYDSYRWKQYHRLMGNFILKGPARFFISFSCYLGPLSSEAAESVLRLPRASVRTERCSWTAEQWLARSRRSLWT